MVVTWKMADQLSLVTDLNHVRDECYGGKAYSSAQHLSHAIAKASMLNMRVEVWRDNTGDFVVSFPSSLGIVKARCGEPVDVINETGPTTFSELLVGVTRHPDMPKPVKTLLVRPKVRGERSLNGTTPLGATSPPSSAATSCSVAREAGRARSRAPGTVSGCRRRSGR